MIDSSTNYLSTSLPLIYICTYTKRLLKKSVNTSKKTKQKAGEDRALMPSQQLRVQRRHDKAHGPVSSAIYRERTM